MRAYIGPNKFGNSRHSRHPVTLGAAAPLAASGGAPARGRPGDLLSGTRNHGAHAPPEAAVTAAAVAAPAPLYTPRWRWPVRSLGDSHQPAPWDILGLLPPRGVLGPYTTGGLPWLLQGLTPAAVLAVLAAADGLLPAGLHLAGRPQVQPLRVALFGPGAAAVLATARLMLGSLPTGRIFIAHAVRGQCRPDEPALPVGVWPLLCGPQPPQDPQPPGGDPAGFCLEPSRLRARFAALPVPPGGVAPPRGGVMRLLCRTAADSAAASPVLPREARSMAGAVPFLYDRLYLILTTLHAAMGAAPDAEPSSLIEDSAVERAYGLTHEAMSDLIAFYARVRPLPLTPALRLAAAILRDRPSTVARTTCGVAGVSDDDARLLEEVGWLRHPDPPRDVWLPAPAGGRPPLPVPRGGRWEVPGEVQNLPPVFVPRQRRGLTPVAVRVSACDDGNRS